MVESSVAIGIGWVVVFGVTLGMTLTILAVVAMGFVAVRNVHKSKIKEEKSSNEQ